MSKMSDFQAFMDSLIDGVPAYSRQSVPSDASMPYLTYNPFSTAFGGVMPLQVDLWAHTASESEINAMAEQVADKIGRGGGSFGEFWVKRGVPFVQALTDPDRSIKRRLINLEIEILSDR